MGIDLDHTVHAEEEVGLTKNRTAWFLKKRRLYGQRMKLHGS